MTYEERLERLKKRVGYQGNSEYNVSQSDSENVRDRLAAARQRYAEEAKAKQTQRATASEAAAQQNSVPQTYEEAKDYIKEQKKQERNKFYSQAADYYGNLIKGKLTFWNDDDNVTSQDTSLFNTKKRAYNRNKDEYNAALDEIKTFEKQEREANAYGALQNSEVSGYIDDIYQNQYVLPKQLNEKAKTQNDNRSGLSNSNSQWMNEDGFSQDLQSGKAIELSGKKADSARAALEEMGYSDDDIDDMLDFYKRNKDGEYTDEVLAVFDRMQSEGGVVGDIMANVASVGATLNSDNKVAAVEDALTGLDALVNDRYVSLNNDSPYKLGTNAKTHIRETTSQEIADAVAQNGGSEKEQDIAQNLYNMGMGLADNTVRNLATGSLYNSASPMLAKLATYGTMASEVAVQTSQSATDRGINADRAALLGIVAGAAEIATEEIGIDNLLGGNKGNVKKYLLNSVLSEGAEEGTSDIINLAADLIISGDDAELRQNVQAYMNNGYDEKSAYIKAITDFAEDVMWDFAGGALSGGIYAGAGAAANSFARNSAYRAEGRAIQDTGREGVAAVINEGLAQDSNSPAYRAASELLSRNYETDSYEIPETLSGRDLGRLGRLQQMNMQANDVSAFSEAVSGEENSKSLVNTFEKLTKGENISKKAANELMNSESARTAITDITGATALPESNSKSIHTALENIFRDYNYGTMQTFSDAEPMNNEQTRQYLNRRLNSVGLQSENEATGTITSRSISNNSVNRAITAADGTADSVQSINRVENGIVYLNTVNGNVVEAQNVDFADSQTAELYNSAAAYDTDTAKVYTFGFTDNGYSGSVYDYNTGFNAVYRAQKQGYSLDDAYNLARESSSITPMQAELAYYAAKNEDIQASKPVLPNSDETSSENIKPAETGAEKTSKVNKSKQDEFNKALNAKKKPGVTVIAEKMSKSQKAEADLIGEYAKSIGREVIIVDDTAELGYGEANGMYKNGKIVLALNNTGGVMSVYFGHELFHDLKQTAPAQANELQAYVLDRLKNNADYDYNARFADLEDKYADSLKGKTESQKKSVIDEEIAANACFTVLSNEDNFTALVKQNRSLAEKVRDFFADFVDKIKNALTRLAKNNAEYRALQNDTEAKEKILAMFNKALESSDTNASNNSEIRLSKKITDSLDSFTNEVLDMNDEQAQKYKSDDTYVSIMTNTPSVILENVKDAEDLEVIMRFDAFYLETRKSGVLDGNYHNLGMAMSELPKFLNNPDAIIRNQNGRLNLITAIGANKNRLISIELNTVKDINSKNRKYNLVVSVFNSGKNYLKNVIKKANALEYEKEDLPQVNHQLHESLATINDKSSNNTVPQNDTVVNNHDIQNEPKYSLKNSDQNAYEQAVNANDLEKAQRFVDKAAIEWGALTDDNGKPIKLYHGTTNQEEEDVWNSITKTFDTHYRKFTVFKNQYAEQSGYFFNSNKDNAGGYGSTVYEVYLKMNKPLIVNCHNENYSAITFEGEVKDTYEWAEYARDKGYDGVIFKNISDGVGYNDLQNITDDYVVFNSSQIKSAETITYDDEGEVIPLNRRFGFYQDIRFSMKETSDYSYKSLVSKPDMSVTVINDQKDYTPGKSTRENVVDEAQRSALSVGRKDSSGNVYVYVNDTDTEVMLSKRGLRHSLDRRLSIIAPVTENIGPIIKNSIRINELSPEFETIKNSYVLIGIAKNQKNEPYVVSFVVNRASNEVMSVDVLYAVNAKKEATALIEPELSSQSDVSLTASTISISDLLDYVNRYYPDILPEDVLRHYGYTARPDGVIGESALYSLKEEDNTSIFEDNEELAESAENVQNMLRLVSTENNELRKAFDIHIVRQVYTYKH